MEALVLAAGLGTRLKPLTDSVPKALVEVGGVPVLERVVRSLAAAGATRVVVTASHRMDDVARFLASKDLGVETVVSREEGGPFETGGGLLAAAPLLRRDAPFFVHNVDVVTDLPLRGIREAHERRRPLATLAVLDRPSSRRLLFDEHGLLGRRDERAGVVVRAREPRGEVAEVPFAGVHVVAPELLARITERGTFPILDVYLRLAAEGARLLPFRCDGASWFDVGRPEGLERARAAVRA